MATTRFKTTTDAIQGGLKNFSIDKAVQNIEGWEDYLHKHDGQGVKAVLADLGKLKKLLQAKDVDSEAIKKLLEKMGKDTVKAAGKENNAEARHIRELGEALSSASTASSTETGEDEPAESEALDADEATDNDEDEGDAEDVEDEEEDDVEDEDDDEDDLDEDEDDEEDGDDIDDDDEDGDDDIDEEDVEEETPKVPARKSVKAPAKKAPAKAARKSR